jgi:hypothetical protein
MVFSAYSIVEVRFVTYYVFLLCPFFDIQLYYIPYSEERKSLLLKVNSNRLPAVP